MKALLLSGLFSFGMQLLSYGQQYAYQYQGKIEQEYDFINSLIQITGIKSVKIVQKTEDIGTLIIDLSSDVRSEKELENPQPLIAIKTALIHYGVSPDKCVQIN